jgi:hypothetical protein
MTDLNREFVHQRLADAVAAASVPANIALWVADLDIILRICVSAGSLILIGFAIWAKVKHWWGK